MRILMVLFFIAQVMIGLSNPLHSKIFSLNTPQSIYIIDNGKEAFFHRIELVKKAESFINIEYFIFNTKTKSAQILIRELVKKAKEGIEIKILLDSFYYNISPNLSNLLIKEGIQIKKYNSSFLISKQGQHRNHRKVFSADDKATIIGGRNISDEYFDIGENFNFYDRDLLIKGDLVYKINQTFNQFWESKLSKVVHKRLAPRAVRQRGPKVNRYSNSAEKRYKKWKADEKQSFEYLNSKIPTIEKIKTQILNDGYHSFTANKEYICNNSTFVSDDPGKIGRDVKDAAIYLYDKIRNIKKSLLIETPYFITKKQEYELLANLLENGKEVGVITNGINGTDSALISALFLDNVDYFTKRGMTAYIHPGRNLYLKNDPKLWALHNKTFLFDRKEVLIGSYNFDPRSKSLNSEMFYECSDNLEMANDVEEIFNFIKSQSIIINKDGTPAHSEDDGLRYYFKYVGSNTFKHLLKYFDFLL